MADDILQFKKTLRKRMVKQRREMDPFERERISDQIVMRFLDSKAYQNARTLMAYASMPEEVQVKMLIEQALQDKKRVAIPLLTESGVMRPVLMPSMDVLVEGAFGIPTVKDEDRIFLQPDAFDCIIVPGAAFDYSGHRLGLGGGYYDNFLPRTSNALKVALAFDFQFVYQVPIEPQDVSVDVVITEAKIAAFYDWGMQLWTKRETPPWL